VVFVPFEVVEKPAERPNKKLGGSVPILLQKLHPVLYPTYRKTEDAARTFLVQVSYKFEDISFAEFSARFQVGRASQDAQHNVRLWLGTHNITECAVIERRLRESLLPCCKAKTTLCEAAHRCLPNLCPVRGVYQNRAESDCGLPFRRHVKVEESTGLCAISDDTLRNRLLKHSLRGQADIDIVGIGISPVRTKPLIIVAFYLIRRNAAVPVIIHPDEHKVVVSDRQGTPTVISDRNSEWN